MFDSKKQKNILLSYKTIDFCMTKVYTIVTARETELNTRARAERRTKMEDMNGSEIIVKEVEKRVLTETLLLIKESESLEELEEKIKTLLNK